MIVLVTDFGLTGPYTGQVKAVLRRESPGVEIIDLFADAPVCDPRSTAYLLAAYVSAFPAGTVFLCVVDPGVGSARVACVVRADRRWFVGPANGVFELVVRRALDESRCWRIELTPPKLSSTFHGRDLFAPVAARLARGSPPPGSLLAIDVGRRLDWPDDLARIVYIDAYGNAMIGTRASRVPKTARVLVNGERLSNAATFSDVPPGSAFWYENANGLLEIAANKSRVSDLLKLQVGTPVSVES